MEHDRSWVAEAALIGIAAVWGLTFVMVQDAVEILPVFTFLAYRFLAAAALVAALFWRRLPGLGTKGLRWGLFMGVFLTAGYVFQTLGLERTRASNAGFITGMFVVLTPIFGALFLRQRAGRPAWIAAGVSTFGLLLVSVGQGGSGEASLAGDALVFGCACSFSFHILVTDKAVRDHDTGALLAVQLAVTGVFSVIVAAAMGDLVVPSDGSVWVALAVTALIASALGFFVQTYAQRHASPSRTALILASEPAFAGLFAFWLAGERLNAAGWLGAALILVSILAVELLPNMRRVPVPEGLVGEVPSKSTLGE
jgi:drug/metabolite transporter (DMT)-like permease